jgi:murein L,D-transpeptidase YcbB/YkuD
MARSGPSTQLSGRINAPTVILKQKLNEEEISELKRQLDAWSTAQREDKSKTFAMISRAVRLFAPKVDQKQWRKRKQVNDFLKSFFGL